jgi:glycosyltransferase involved in cell wall biosynthesis
VGDGVSADAMIEFTGNSESHAVFTDSNSNCGSSTGGSTANISAAAPHNRPEKIPSAANQLSKRILVFDCHEAWVYQLRFLGFPLDIVVGLRGRYKDDWDHDMRPLPPNSRLVRPTDFAGITGRYHCIIAHNLSDLLDVKFLYGPRLLVLHETLDGNLLEQKSTVTSNEMKRAIAKYTQMTNTHVVAVSKIKGKSWGFSDDIVPFSAAIEDYPAWQGDIVRGLRIANHIMRRPTYLMWEFHKKAFGDIPVTLVGNNPEMDGVYPSSGWTDLKTTLSHHRFYIHTAHPQLEDGYNMASLEAMAAGLPVLGNVHPTSPVTNGVNGFLSDDPAELRDRATQLLEDRELAARMGATARKAVEELFSPSRFAEKFGRSIVAARNKWMQGRAK